RAPNIAGLQELKIDTRKGKKPMSDEAPFRVLGYRESPLKHDGTFPRNRWWVSVEVDGKIHEVSIRDETFGVHLPPELRKHQLGKAIKSAASRYLAADLLPKLH